MDTQGHAGTYLFEHFITLDHLMPDVESSEVLFEQLAKENEEAESYRYLANAAKSAWSKIEKYFLKADGSPIYYAAIIMNLTLKACWFRDYWQDHIEKSEWIDQVKALSKELWLEDYKHLTLQTNGCQPVPPANRSAKSAEDHAYRRLHNAKRLKPNPKPTLTDDYDNYLDTDPLADDQPVDLIDYWMARRKQSPQLAALAFDTLAIPLMSADCERYFSSAKSS